MATEVGQNYNEEIFTGVVNIGHALLSVRDGIVIGRLDYPGPGSGGFSMQRGDCSAILEGRAFLAGGQADHGDDSHMPRVGIEGGFVNAAGWAKDLTFKRSLGPGQGAVDVNIGDWTYVNADGTIGTPPGVPDAKAQAAKAFEAALVTLAAAAAVLAS